VPTWNYVTVHAWGSLIVHDDRAWLDQHVRHLTDSHEARREFPWSVDDAPPEYISKLLGGIVGFEIPITRLQAKWKLNQNHPPANFEGVIRGLEAGDERDRRVAQLMRKLD
jgi:transcriptional regulator